MSINKDKEIIIFCNGDVRTVQSQKYTNKIIIRGTIVIGVALLLLRFSSMCNYQLGTVKQETVVLESMLRKQEQLLNEKEAELNKYTNYRVIFEKAKELGFIGISKHFEKLAVSDEHFDPRWLTEYRNRVILNPMDEEGKIAEKNQQSKKPVN